ncbi:MAG: type II secretion system protein [Candidatus Moranbacteria bacterium]|nr:type II secretion system protein [Candidatus Moranbacteria bacterium]
MEKSADKKMNTIRGFTLIEVIVAMFVFVIIMTTVSGIFGRAFQGYRSAKVIQRDLEAAQYAINLIAKSLRTSSVASPIGQNLTTSSVRIFDYSQNKCIRYAFSGTEITLESADDPGDSAPDKIDWCTTTSLSSPASITSGTVTGNFYSTSSDPTIVGKVTIALKVCPVTGCDGNPRDEAKIQTSVSLRDYTETGL